MRKYSLIFAVLVFCFLGFRLASAAYAAELLEPQSNCSGLACDGGACEKDEDSPFEITLSGGSLISQLWIKASSGETACFLFTADGDNGCYTVTGIGTQTVRAVKSGLGDSCHDISHIEAIVSPTAVTVYSFLARCRPDLILIRWTTAYEEDIYGYNVYRKIGQFGNFHKINNNIIPAAGLGNLIGTNYSFKDRYFNFGTRYFYKLEIIDSGLNNSFYETLATARCLP